jgi:hypothetical protein
MGKNKKKSVSLISVTNIDEFNEEKALDTNAEKILDEIVEKALDSAEELKGSAEEPKGSAEEPKDSTEEPSSSAEEPKGSAEEPKDSTEEPNGSVEELNGSVEEPVKLDSVSAIENEKNSVELIEISLENPKQPSPQPKKKSDCSKGFCIIL